MAAVGSLGLMLVSIALVVASLFVLFELYDGIMTSFNAIASGLLGVALLWTTVSGLRGWRAFLEEYVVDSKGVHVKGSSSESFLPWDGLATAVYRKAYGQLELRFVNTGRLIVLTNVDMDLDRRTVKAAASLLEAQSAIPIRRTLV